MEEGAAIPSTAAAEEAKTDLPQAQQQAAKLQPGMTLLESKTHLTSRILSMQLLTGSR